MMDKLRWTPSGMARHEHGDYVMVEVIDRMRPVYEAAIMLRDAVDAGCADGNGAPFYALLDAVDEATKIPSVDGGE